MNVDPRDVIAILALLVALITPVTTYAVARGRNRHEAQMADEARTHQRLETVYVDVIEYAHLLVERVDRRHPFISWSGEPPPPDVPPGEARRRLRSRVDAFGTPAVQARLTDLGECVRAFDLVAAELDDLNEGHDTGRPPIDVRRDLDDKRAAVHAARDALTAECSQELR
jgi:hypothetical protein